MADSTPAPKTEKLVKVYHPNPDIQSVYEVAASDVEDWTEQGWLKSAPKTQNA